MADPLQLVLEQSRATFADEQHRRGAGADAAGAAKEDESRGAAGTPGGKPMHRGASATSAVMGSMSFRKDLDGEPDMLDGATPEEEAQFRAAVELSLAEHRAAQAAADPGEEQEGGADDE